MDLDLEYFLFLEKEFNELKKSIIMLYLIFNKNP